MDGSGRNLVALHVAHMLRRGLRPNTIALRKAVLRRLEIHAGKSLHRITLEDIRAFVDRLPDAGSRSTESTQLRSFYKWAALEGYVREDPTFRLEPIRKRKYLPRPIGDDLLALALSDPPDRVKPMLWLAAYAGLRAHDIAQLRGEHLLWDREPAVVFIEDSKGGKSRTVPMSPQVRLLRSCLPARGWCFPYVNGRSGHISAHLVSKLCNEYLHSLGISETLHQLRHWAITSMYSATGRDLLATQNFAGHENPSTTQGYAWVDPGLIAEAVMRMPDVLGDGSVSPLRVAG